MKQLLPIMNDFFMPCEKSDHERERFILPKHHNALRLRPRTSAGPLNVARKASSTSNNAIGMGYPCVFFVRLGVLFANTEDHLQENHYFCRYTTNGWKPRRNQPPLPSARNTP